MNDLEQLLKQYGEDLRQQKAVAQRLRRRAARQRAAVAMCGMVALALAGVLLGRRLAEAPAARLAGVRVPHSVVRPAPAGLEAVGEAIRTAVGPKADVELGADGDSGNVAPAAVADLPAAARGGDFVFLGVEGEQLPERLPMNESLAPWNSQLDELAESGMPASVPRLRWDVRLSAGRGGLGNDYTSGFGPFVEPSFSPNESTAGPSFSVHELGMLSGNMGVNVTLASVGRSRLELGVAVEGYVNRVNVTMTQTKLFPTKYIAPHAGSENGFAVNTTTCTVTENIYGLNIAVPLMWDFYPSRNGHVGYQIRVSPARSVMVSDYASARYGQYINPWKLNIGMGVVVPKGVVKNVGVSANLLPMYKNGAIHQFGITIGF